MGLKGIDVLKNNIYMIKVVWKYSKSYFFVFISLILMTVVKDMLLVVAPKFIFDSMQYGTSIEDIFIPIIAYVTLYLGIHLILYFLTYARNILEEKIKMNLNVALGNKFMRVDYSFLEKNSSIDMFNKAKMAISGGLDDIQTLGMNGEQGITGYFDQLMKIIKDVILLCSVLYVFRYMQIYMFFIVIGCIGLNLFFSLIKMKETVKVRDKAGPYLTKSRYCNKLLRTFEFGQEFRVFGMSDLVISKFHECTDEYVQVRNASKTPSCMASVFFNIINNVMRGAVLIYLIRSLLAGNLSVGDFSMVFAAVLTFSDTMLDLLGAILTMNILALYMTDYQNCMKLKEADNSEGIKQLENVQHMIEFRDVWYKYRNAEEYALRGINITIKPYEKISIVGYNGAGKTTFIKLLLGLYRPEKGEILIDGINLEEYSRESYYGYVSAVFQDFKIFALSIRENITLCDGVDWKLFEKSIERAGIAKRIGRLQQKEEAVIGGFFEEGDFMLSGGESQKIAMSRSFYRNTNMIVLDEPTSALDVAAEDEMYGSVADNSRQQLLFISHRLASSRICDRILVFKNGQIAESGTHGELLQRKGIYCSMWSAQAEKFNGGLQE